MEYFKGEINQYIGPEEKEEQARKLKNEILRIRQMRIDIARAKADDNALKKALVEKQTELDAL